MALAPVIVQIQGLSSTDDDLNALHTQLTGPGTDALLKASVGGILESLQNLDINYHSLGYLYLLEAKGRHGCRPDGDAGFFTATARFLTLCNGAQIRKAPSKFSSLCTAFRTQGIALHRPKYCINPLRCAIRALCPTPGCISPIHTDFLQVCLLSKCYSTAAALLHEDAYQIDPKATGVTATDILLYCYYGGMVETGRRQYKRAYELYLTAVTAPTQVVNAITIAALKKLYLVSLLLTGKAPVLPSYTASIVSRLMKSECAAYTELAKEVTSAASGAPRKEQPNLNLNLNFNQNLHLHLMLDPMLQQQRQEGPQQQLLQPPYAVAIASVVDALYSSNSSSGKHFSGSKGDPWVADGNAGLVRCIVETHGQRRIQTLTETYCSLSLSETAILAQLPHEKAAEGAVLKMVEEGQVHARVNEEIGMVAFDKNPDAWASAETAARLDNLIQRCMNQARSVASVDLSVTCDRAFINKADVGRAGALGGGGGGGGGGSGDALKMPFLGVDAGGASSPVIGEVMDTLDDVGMQTAD